MEPRLVAGVKLRPRYLEGVQRISQRAGTCNCGCGGKDTWHSTNIKRQIRDVEVLEAPEPVKAWYDRGITVNVLARGYYHHPSGDLRPAGLWVDEGVVINWVAICVD